MRLTNPRSGTVVEGKFICIIPAGATPTDDQLLAYWHLKPGDARFADHARPFSVARCVLLKHNGNFVITPLSKDITEVTE